MGKTVLVLAALIMVVGLVFNGCTPTEPKAPVGVEGGSQYGGILKMVAYPRAPSKFGYPLHCMIIDMGFGDQFYDGLIRQAPPPKLFEPDLAESWELSTDKKTYTFHLRKGVTFHDGTDFNAQAVKYNFDIILERDKTIFQGVTSIEVVDDYTLQINTSDFNPALLYDLTRGQTYIASPTAMEELGERGMLVNPVGTGAFKFVSYERDVRLIGERFDDYWREGLPYLDGIQFDFVSEKLLAQAALENGDVDIIIRAEPIVSSELGGKVYNIVSCPATVRVLLPNTAHPDCIFRNKQVLEAMEYAINKEQIAERLGHGFFSAAYQVAPPGNYSYNPALEPRTYNPERARQLLAEAGYPDGFSCTIIGTAAPLIRKELWTAVQSDLANVGIEVNLDLVEQPRIATFWFQGGLEDPNTLISKHLPANAEFFLQLKGDFYSTSPLHPYLAKPEGLDALLLEGNRAEREEKARITQAVVKMIYDEGMLLPIWVEYTTWPMVPAVQNPPYCKIDQTYATYEETWLKKE